MKTPIFLLVFVLFSFSVLAQDETEESEAKESKHFVAISVGYSYIPKGTSEHSEEADGIFIPSIGLDYFYRLAPKWELGTMIDFELGEYLIFEKDLNREYALVVTAVVSYSVTQNINLFAGGGIEFEKNYNLGVFRFGGEYGFQLKNAWKLSPGFFYDIKEGYDTFSFSISIGKEF